MFAISTVDGNGIRTVVYLTESRDEALSEYGSVYDGLLRDDSDRAFDADGKKIVWVLCEDVSDASLLAEKYPDTRAGELVHATRTCLPI